MRGRASAAGAAPFRRSGGRRLVDLDPDESTIDLYGVSAGVTVAF